MTPFIALTAVVATALLTLSPHAAAQSATARQQFEAGAAAYLKGDAQAAIAAWLKGSALEGNTQATTQANGLRQVEDFYGKPESYEVLAEHKVSDRSVVVLGVINFQKGPLYTRFQNYRLAGGGWVTTEFKVHTEVSQLFPNSAIYGR